MPSNALLEAFDVTEEDLALNREGRLSERQRDDLKGQVGLLKLVLPVLGVVFLLFAALFAVLQLWPAVAVVGLMLLFMFAMGARTGLRATRDARAGRVVCVSGPIKRSLTRPRRSAMHGKRRVSSYAVDAGGESFVVEAAQYEALKDGQTYRLYVTEKGRNIVSAEES